MGFVGAIYRLPLSLSLYLERLVWCLYPSVDSVLQYYFWFINAEDVNVNRSELFQESIKRDQKMFSQVTYNNGLVDDSTRATCVLLKRKTTHWLVKGSNEKNCSIPYVYYEVLILLGLNFFRCFMLYLLSHNTRQPFPFDAPQAHTLPKNCMVSLRYIHHLSRQSKHQ